MIDFRKAVVVQIITPVDTLSPEDRYNKGKSFAIEQYNRICADMSAEDATATWLCLTSRGDQQLMYGPEPIESESDRIAKITKSMCK